MSTHTPPAASAIPRKWAWLLRPLPLWVALAAAAGGIALGTTADRDSANAAHTPAPTVTVTGPTQTVTITAAPEKTPAQQIVDGTWIVGQDIAPGDYRTAIRIGDEPGICYWEIATGPKSTDIYAADMIANDYARVSLTWGDHFESKNCGLWVPDK